MPIFPCLLFAIDSTRFRYLHIVGIARPIPTEDFTQEYPKRQK